MTEVKITDQSPQKKKFINLDSKLRDFIISQNKPKAYELILNCYTKLYNENADIRESKSVCGKMRKILTSIDETKKDEVKKLFVKQ